MHEYLLRSDGFTRAQQRDYEHMRWLVWQMMMPHFKKGHIPGSPRAFLRFGWEEMSEEEAAEKVEACKITEEEVAELNRIFAEHDRKTKNNG